MSNISGELLVIGLQGSDNYCVRFNISGIDDFSKQELNVALRCSSVFISTLEMDRTTAGFTYGNHAIGIKQWPC